MDHKDTHPFKLLRHSLEPKLTIKSLAEMCLIEDLTVIRTEQSLFQTPPESIVYVLSNLTDYTIEELTRRYNNWATTHRHLTGKALLLARPVGGSTFSTPISLFLKQAWLGSSLQQRAKNLCVHQSTLLRYEHGLQAFMPGQLVVALTQAGLDNETIMELDRLGQVWYAKYS